MARPNKSGKSSFGKRTDAENSFRKSKGKGGAREEGDKKRSGRSDGSARSFSSGPRFRSKPDGERSSERPYKKREDSTGSDRPSRFSKSSERPYKRRDDNSSEDRPKRFTKSSGTGRSFGRDDEKRPYKKRDDSSSDERPRYSRSSGSERSFDKGESRPYKRRDEGSSEDRPKRFSSSGPKRFGDNDDKKPYEKRESGSFKRPRVSSDEKRPFKKDEEKKSFVQSRLEKQNAPTRPEYKEEKKDDGLIRLNKFIANSGVCSRREADELIKMGLISVNGVTITEMGYKVKPTDEVRHEDKRLKAEKPVYVLLNKPKGFITTTDDPQERNTVMSIVASACKERIYPVGRLDRNTTGLLLLTNDGDLTDKLTHPSYNVKKIYKAELDKPLTKNDFQKIADGVHLEEGKAIVDDIAIVSDDGLTVGLEIHIGWNRIVRRIFESLGYTVVKLDRVVYAGLDKKDLKRGQWRFLKSDEVVRLKHFK